MSFRAGTDGLAACWVDNSPETIALHDRMSVLFFLLVGSAPVLAVSAVISARSRRLNHGLGWIFVLAFLWCARCAWLSYRHGYPSWLGDEYHFYGLLFPQLAVVFALLAGLDSATGYHSFVRSRPGWHAPPLSFGTRAASAVFSIASVLGFHWLWLTAFAFGFAACSWMRRRS